MAIGNLSCLDRMVDPSIKVVDEVDRRSQLVRGDTDRSSGREDNSQFSRQGSEPYIMYFQKSVFLINFLFTSKFSTDVFCY